MAQTIEQATASSTADALFIHSTACVDDPASLGHGTQVWHFCHVMPGAQIGAHCRLGQNVFVAPDVVIGDNVKIQNNVSLYAGCRLEDDVFCGPSCVFTNVVNPRSEVPRRDEYRQTLVRRGATIGANATVVCGHEIGRYAFVGAGAVVTQDVPDYALVVGVPARRVGWMSRHGHRLSEPDAEGVLRCPSSGWRYREMAPGVLRCLDREEDAPLQPQLVVVHSSREEPRSAPAADAERPSEGDAPVPLLDLNAQHRALAPELRAAFDRVLSHGQFVLGAEVQEFERELAASVGAAHAIGCASGSDALLLALMALDVGPGDEVILPTYTFFATGGAVVRVGATPVFVDVDPETANIDPEGVRQALTPRTRVIIPVHLFGQCSEMTPLTELAAAHGIAVVEDAAQALGAEYAGKRAGTLGRAACFSFFPSKNLGGFGDGGALTTDDEQLSQRLRILRAHGAQPKYYHSMVGINSRLDALQAALLRVKLPHLDVWTEARRQNAERYTAAFCERGLSPRHFQVPVVRQSRHIFNQYVIRLADREQRDALQRALREARIGVEIYYPVPLHLQPCFEALGYTRGQLPVSETLAETTLALPIFPELLPAQQARVICVLEQFFARE
jgi:dTDP-4-amino-4,6-dideoxygalactose transaminase/acetyltransferase-like isoleucine patch superfamily enzyme